MKESKEGMKFVYRIGDFKTQMDLREIGLTWSEVLSNCIYFLRGCGYQIDNEAVVDHIIEDLADRELKDVLALGYKEQAKQEARRAKAQKKS